MHCPIAIREISPNRQQRHIRPQPPPNLLKPVKISRIARVIHRAAPSTTYPPYPRCVSLNIRAPQCLQGVIVTRSPCTFRSSHHSISCTRTKPKPHHQILHTLRHHNLRSLPRNRRVARTTRRSEVRFKWSICACVSSTTSIAGSSFNGKPGRRCRRSTTSRFENTGSTRTFFPPTCSRKEECPINVIPVSPGVTSSGSRETPA